jgi:hypothetical protein
MEEEVLDGVKREVRNAFVRHQGKNGYPAFWVGSGLYPPIADAEGDKERLALVIFLIL